MVWLVTGLVVPVVLGVVLDDGLARLHLAVISEDGQHVGEHLDHVSHHGGSSRVARLWRRLSSQPVLAVTLPHAQVVFDVPRQYVPK